MQHIPTMDIRTLGDIGFDEQLRRALEPSQEYDVEIFWGPGGKTP